MTNEQSFFISILHLMPTNSTCYIQAPSLESSLMITHLKETEFPYYKSIELNSSNKNFLIECISNGSIQDEIQSVEIRFDDKLLFEGFDGVEYGIISKNFHLTNDFIEKYVNNDFCTVAIEW